MSGDKSVTELVGFSSSVYCFDFPKIREKKSPGEATEVDYSTKEFYCEQPVAKLPLAFQVWKAPSGFGFSVMLLRKLCCQSSRSHLR